MKRIFLIYIIVFFLFSLIFISSFSLPLDKFQPVLFYRGLLLLGITILISGTCIYVVVKNNYLKQNTESLISAVLVSAAIHLSFFVVFPVTFERSITMYLLETIDGNENSELCAGISKLNLENKLIDEYVIKNKAIDKRITEQKVLDFIKEENQCIKTTPRNKSFLKFSEIIKRLYSI